MSRIARVERIGLLYRRLEQLRELELHVAAADVAAVVHLQTEERTADQAEAALGRRALAAGEREDRMLAEAGRKLIGLRLVRHGERRVNAERDRDLAQEIYSESRLRREQMERIGDGQRRVLEAEQGRLEQAALDDRFLARRAWLEARQDSRSTGSSVHSEQT